MYVVVVLKMVKVIGILIPQINRSYFVFKANFIEIYIFPKYVT